MTTPAIERVQYVGGMQWFDAVDKYDKDKMSNLYMLARIALRLQAEEVGGVGISDMEREFHFYIKRGTTPDGRPQYGLLPDYSKHKAHKVLMCVWANVVYPDKEK